MVWTDGRTVKSPFMARDVGFQILLRNPCLRTKPGGSGSPRGVEWSTWSEASLFPYLVFHPDPSFASLATTRAASGSVTKRAFITCTARPLSRRSPGANWATRTSLGPYCLIRYEVVYGLVFVRAGWPTTRIIRFACRMDESKASAKAK